MTCSSNNGKIKFYSSYCQFLTFSPLKAWSLSKCFRINLGLIFGSVGVIITTVMLWWYVDEACISRRVGKKKIPGSILIFFNEINLTENKLKKVVQSFLDLPLGCLHNGQKINRGFSWPIIISSRLFRPKFFSTFSYVLWGFKLLIWFRVFDALT